MNKVLLTGRLTYKKELRTSQTGNYNISFGIACKKTKEESDFINLKAFSKTAEVIDSFAEVGALVSVVGKVSSGSFEKDGKKIYTQDIIANSIDLISRAPKKDGESQEVNWEDKKEVTQDAVESFDFKF